MLRSIQLLVVAWSGQKQMEASGSTWQKAVWCKKVEGDRLCFGFASRARAKRPDSTSGGPVGMRRNKYLNKYLHMHLALESVP